MTHFIEDIKKKLINKNFKFTPQRESILKTLIENRGKHLSAEEVYDNTREKNPEIGLATVYRTLDLLSEVDILQKLNFEDGKVRYEFKDERAHHHHHLICLKCGSVSEFEGDLLDSLEKAITHKTGFYVTNHKLKFYGYCNKCQ